jgi:hypothetical protein
VYVLGYPSLPVPVNDTVPIFLAVQAAESGFATLPQKYLRYLPVLQDRLQRTCTVLDSTACLSHSLELPSVAVQEV